MALPGGPAMPSARRPPRRTASIEARSPVFLTTPCSTGHLNQCAASYSRSGCAKSDQTVGGGRLRRAWRCRGRERGGKIAVGRLMASTMIRGGCCPAVLTERGRFAQELAFCSQGVLTMNSPEEISTESSAAVGTAVGQRRGRGDGA